NTNSGVWNVGEVISVAVTFVVGSGETTASPMSNSVTITWCGFGDPWRGHRLDVRNMPSGPAAVTAKRIHFYRSSAGGGWLGYIEVPPTQNDLLNIDAPVMSGLPPSVNAAQIRLIHLSNIPIGPSGTTARRISRDTASDPTWKLQQTINNNTAAASTDQTFQGSLGPAAPGSNTTAVNQVTITGIATGPSGTTARKVYRTAVNAAQLKLLPTGSTFTNNSHTGPYVDVIADASLGANAPTVDTSGLTPASGYILPGSTSILTVSAAVFAGGGGWALHGQQWIRYKGIAAEGGTLVGGTARAVGAITTSLTTGAAILPGPALVGVSGLTAAIAKGSAVHIWVQRDDTAAQAALGQLERNPDGSPTDGIREF